MAEDKKNKSVLQVDREFLDDIEELIRSGSDAILKNLLLDLYDFDIAVIIDNLEEDKDALYLFSMLTDETASEVLLEITDHRRDYITENLEGKQLSNIVSEMYSDDATDLISELDTDKKEELLQNLDTIDREDTDEVRELLGYEENTAGGIMAKEYLAVHADMTVAETIKLVQDEGEEIDQFYNVWIVDNEEKLAGIISLKRLIIALKTPDKKISEVMNRDVISVEAGVDQEEVANIFRSYDLVSAPVVDSTGRLIGKITIDDVIDVMDEEHSEDVAAIIGTDAEELERKSPLEIAKLRLPWVLITLGIELIGGFVIHKFDVVLEKVILLASFMPVISAISGNTGLQSAAIVVRAIDQGYVNISNWMAPVKRQLATTLIIGSVVGLMVGIVGYLWSTEQALRFGITVGVSMFISINLSGAVGTIFPMLSKRFGFDPAITSGPFETAFQDVVGISIFLSIATYLLTSF